MLNFLKLSALLLPVLGPLEQYMTPTLDSALLISSRAGADLGRLIIRLSRRDHRASPLYL